MIGGGLGGMTAAGELARAGCAVTLFELGPSLGGKAAVIEDGGVILDTGPTLLTLPEVVRAGFQRLDAADLLPRFIELDTQCEYHFSDGQRFTAHRELEAMVTSAAALGPHEGAGLRTFYAEAEAIYRAAGEPYLEAPLEGMVDYLTRVGRRSVWGLLRGAKLGTLARLAARHFRTGQLRQFVGRFATYAGASPYQASAAFALIPHLERAFGVHHVEGGLGALVTALGKALVRLGVEVRLDTPARCEAEGSGFRVGPPGDARRFDSVVVNADPLASVRRSEDPLALSGYVLLVSVDRRLTLPHHTASFTPDYRAEFDGLFEGRIPADPTLYLCHPVASDPTMAPEGHSGVFLMVNAPPLRHGPSTNVEREWRALAIRLREGCLAGLRRLCPEMAGASVRVLAERTPVDLARRGAPRGSIYGFLPHGRLGPFGRPRMRAEAPGMFFAGGGTHPGGGVPLVMLSGHFAAQLAANHLELAG